MAELSISVIIPTLNRPNDMARLLPTILNQTRLPDELIVVDQSQGNETKNTTKTLLKDSTIKLNYIHDSSFNGLVKAKEIGTKNASGDIIAFLDDDSTLDSAYFSQIIQGFIDKKDMVGCMGVCINTIPSSQLYLFAHSKFYRGIFADPRPHILKNIHKYSEYLILSNFLSGGVSAWKKEVLNTIPFDQNGIHHFEDAEFSTRVAKHYGNHLYVNIKAHAQHLQNLHQRPNFYQTFRRKIGDAFIFYKKHHQRQGAKSGLSTLLLWWLIEAIIIFFRSGKISGLLGYFSGIHNGLKIKVKNNATQ